MSSMEQAQILHNLRNHFSITDDQFQGLLDQIENEKYRNNFLRITAGLTVEDIYKSIFGSLPWVKSITGLHQQQEQRHREDYQIPDYSVLIEDSQKETFPILVDVKSVKGKKVTCEIMVKQLRTLKKYATGYKSKLLIAIYWEDLGYWTHNCLSNFEGKKKNKISLESAIKNDLSHILSDYTYFMNKRFYRKTYFSENKVVDGACHTKHGEMVKILIGQNISNLKEYNVIHSSIIDCMFNMKEIEVGTDDIGKFSIEVYEPKSIMLIKTSKWITNFLKIWGIDHLTRVGDDILVTELARVEIVEFMKDLNVKVSYQIPDNKNDETKEFFNLAYKDTTVMDDYLNS